MSFFNTRGCGVSLYIVPEGGGHAIRPCLCMFRKGRPLLPWLHFGFHFGVILGALGAYTNFGVTFSQTNVPQHFKLLFKRPPEGLPPLRHFLHGGEAKCGFRGPMGRTTGGARRTNRDPTRLMTPKGVGGFSLTYSKGCLECQSC